MRRFIYLNYKYDFNIYTQKIQIKCFFWSFIRNTLYFLRQVFERMEKRPLTSTGSARVAVREKNTDKLIFCFLRIKSPCL